VAGQTQLPPGCTGSNCVSATANGNYPQVFNNALVDGSFGVTSRIFLAEITPSGLPLRSYEVPANELVTSFSSWAITSTVSGSGDQGADPNKLVKITDPLSATSAAAGGSFRTIRAAGFGEVLRGVSFTPGSAGR
jgi:hypothetical protein